MRFTLAQPLMPVDKGGQLEPRPLLSPAEAEVEAELLKCDDPQGYFTEVLEDVPVELFSQKMRAMLAAGELGHYTHLACPYGGRAGGTTAEPTCRDYLVRIEP